MVLFRYCDQKNEPFYPNVYNIISLFFFFCQKVKAVNNILNYSSNSNNTVFELTNIFLRKKSIDRLSYN